MLKQKSSRRNGKSTPPRTKRTTPPKTPDRYPRDVFETPPFSPPSRAHDITPRRLDTTSSSLTNATSTSIENRTVYLIRHGESQGQASSREMRQKDPSLLDCRLTSQGQDQARLIPQLLGDETIARIQYVICSPLTRALETAVLAFPQHPILVAYDLREVGSPIPENMPRKTKDALRDLQDHLPSDMDSFHLDVKSLKPDQWPHRAETPPKVVRRDRIRQVFVWLADTLPQDVREIAVVCHYHVIRTALSDPYDPMHAKLVHQHIHPANAEPIKCELTAEGKLILADGEVERVGKASSRKKTG